MEISAVPRAADAWEHRGWPAQAPASAPDQAAAASRLVALTVIGNQLRMPVASCEAGGCGARYEDWRALGEADIRARAIASGWREDLTGLLTCPGCQQCAPWPHAFRPGPPGAGRPYPAAAPAATAAPAEQAGQPAPGVPGWPAGPAQPSRLPGPGQRYG